MYFDERQRFPLFVYVALLSAPLIVLGAWWAVPEVPLSIVLMTAVVQGLLCLLFAMRTEVRPGEVVVRFGIGITWYRKRLPLDGGTVIRSVVYRPIRNAGGWGIRWGRFEGRACRYLNARGKEGVLLEHPDYRFIIGTGQTDALAEALDRARQG